MADITYDVLVSGDSSRFETWPSICKSSNGTLYNVYTHYDSNAEDITGKIVMRISTDDGATWGSESTVQDTASVDDRNPIIACYTYNSTEYLIVGYTILSGYIGKITTSPTSSISWSTPITLASGASLGGGNPIVTSQNKMLIPSYKRSGDDRFGYIYECDLDDNNCANWTEYDVNDAVTMSEWSIIEVKTGGSYTGGVYAMIRVNGEPDYMYEAWSTDYGHTFSTPTVNSDIALCGQSPSRMIRLPDDSILATYAYARTAACRGPETSIRLAVSTDEGQTWGNVMDVVRYHNGSQPNEDMIDYPDVVLNHDEDTLIFVCHEFGWGTLVNADVWLNYVNYPLPSIIDYTYKKTLTFDTSATGANVSSNQTDFPICVHINTSSWPTQGERDAFFDTNTNGKRINFYDSDEEIALSYEVEYFDNSQGAEEAVYWVRSPQVDGNSTTDSIVVAYGNDPYSEDQDAPASVWDSYFEGIWHLGDNSWGSSPEAKDSTGSYNGTNSGSSDAEGLVRRSRSFDGSDYISMDDNLDIGTTNFTYTFVFNTTTTSNYIMSKDGGSNSGFWVETGRHSAGDIGFNVGTGSVNYKRIYTDDGGYNDGNTHVCSITVNRDTEDILIYIDGDALNTTVEEDYGVLTGDADNAENHYLGRRTTNYYTGMLDEVRRSDTIRSADWCRLEYYTMKKTNWNGDDWLAWGSQEETSITRSFGLIMG